MPRGAYSYRPTRTAFIHASVDDDSRAKVGGTVVQFKAGAALKLGDVVYISAADTVNKSTTAADHRKRIGVVVGGAHTNDEVVDDSTLYNVSTAADADEDVLVLVFGIAYVTVAGALSAGDLIIPDTVTAGRVKAGADISVGIGTLDATIDAGAVAVTSSGANGAIATVTGSPSIAGDTANRALGMMLEASTVAGQVRRAIIYLA